MSQHGAIAHGRSSLNMSLYLWRSSCVMVFRCSREKSSSANLNSSTWLLCWGWLTTKRYTASSGEEHQRHCKKYCQTRSKGCVWQKKKVYQGFYSNSDNNKRTQADTCQRSQVPVPTRSCWLCALSYQHIIWHILTHSRYRHDKLCFAHIGPTEIIRAGDHNRFVHILYVHTQAQIKRDVNSRGLWWQSAELNILSLCNCAINVPCKVADTYKCHKIWVKKP